MRALRELQERFFAALSQPAEAPVEPSLVAIVSSTPLLDAAARIAIYRRMYRDRLVDVLREDFPRTRVLLGERRFTAFAERYVLGHPSRHPSLREFGAGFPDSVDRDRTPGDPPHAADLARLEWARFAVFDAPDPQPLRLASLRETPPEAWGVLRFRVIDALVILDSRWPIHDTWAALGASRDHDTTTNAPPPDASSEPVPGSVADDTRERPTTLRVWREAHTVYQASMSPLERDALARIRDGETFGALCAGIARDHASEEAATRAAALLGRWLEDGILEPFAAVQRVGAERSM